jgi:hypothetical protein
MWKSNVILRCCLNVLPVPYLIQRLMCGRGWPCLSTIIMWAHATEEVIGGRWCIVCLHHCIRVFRVLNMETLMQSRFPITQRIATVFILWRLKGMCALVDEICGVFLISELPLSTLSFPSKVGLIQHFLKWLVYVLGLTRASRDLGGPFTLTCSSINQLTRLAQHWLFISAEVIAHSWHHWLSQWVELDHFPEFGYVLRMLLMVSILHTWLCEVNLPHHHDIVLDDLLHVPLLIDVV